MADERWEKAVRIVRKQWGVVSRQQLVAAGLDRAAIRWRIEGGHLEEVSRGVYRLPGPPLCWEGRALAALVLMPPSVALSHQSAAHLWRFSGFERPGSHVVVTAPHQLRREHQRLIIHRSRLPFKVIARGPLRVTSVARTLVDLAAELQDARLEDALDSAQRLHPDTSEKLGRALRSLKDGRAGTARLRRLLALRSTQFTDSRFESEVGRALRAAGLPTPSQQFVVCDADGYVLRVDFAWPGHRVALHVDGYTWHQQRSRFEKDRSALNRLAALGWQSFFVTRRSFDDRSWLAPLRAALELRAPQLSLW